MKYSYLRTMEMIKLTSKDIRRIHNDLKHGDKKEICYQLGIKQSNLSMMLRPRVLFNTELDKYETVYVMPKNVFEHINQYINNK